MIRLAGLVVAALLVSAVPVKAEAWAEKMFETRSHDFGPVARAAKVEFEFVLTNRFKEDIHIASVRSSCGCTSPTITKEWLKSREKSSIVAAFNTRTFSGQHQAHLTVTFDQPTYAEVELDVKGYIRTDIVVDPGLVSLGTVDEGSTTDRTVEIEYAGREDWKILSAKSDSPYLSTDIKETSRGNGNVKYQLAVHLKEGAPTGYLKDELTLKTNDARTPTFPVAVEGRVVAGLAISPSSLMLGILQPGQKVTKKVIVTGKKPFRVTGVECNDPAFKLVSNTPEAKKAHVVEVTFTAGNQPGKISQQIRIHTDNPTHPDAELTAYGQITSPLAGN